MVNEISELVNSKPSELSSAAINPPAIPSSTTKSSAMKVNWSNFTSGAIIQIPISFNTALSPVIEIGLVMIIYLSERRSENSPLNISSSNSTVSNKKPSASKKSKKFSWVTILVGSTAFSSAVKVVELVNPL